MQDIYYDLIDIGTLGGMTSDAVALNNCGQIIGHSDTLAMTNGKIKKEAYLWSKGRMINLGEVRVRAINNDCIIVGQRRTDKRPVIWNDHKFQPLPFEMLGVSYINDINDKNEIVGWLRVPNKVTEQHSDNIKNCAFVADDKGVRLLENNIDSKISEAIKINNNGNVVGTIKQNPVSGSLTYRSVGAIWNDNGLKKITPLSNFNESQAIDINNNGQILCKAIYNQMEELFDKEQAKHNIVSLKKVIDDVSLFRQCGFIYTKNYVQVISSDVDTGFNLHIVRALNNHGIVVGSTGCGPDLTEKPSAFIFKEKEIYNLNEFIYNKNDWKLLDARDINDNGQIVGVGICAGVRKGFLLNPR